MKVSSSFSITGHHIEHILVLVPRVTPRNMKCFWGIICSILLNRSWRHTYFKFLNNLTDNIYVMIVVKYKRWLKD
ncbi:hypothetical protein MTR_7g009770 [Medicago truncatula]|uniref:Uncharacterized protein n=1 Tax=Medicago truncatula TaxID=3880 RepID=G7KZV3_MEDTR|nr:hypothetical protein MTR_7g009770 [Medicago truncatula]